jgi:uncharacterized membrane protein
MTNYGTTADLSANGAGRVRGRLGMSGLMQTITTAGAIGAALIGGVFFAFSAFVMPALRRLPAAQGIGAMQSINRTAVTAPLMLALFGTAVLSGIAIAWAIRSWGHVSAPWLLAGGLAYLAAVVITMAGNVPLNDSLAGLDPASAGAPAQWASFVSHWTAWNHLRGAVAVAGGLAFILGLIRA